jgi:hypothetical protein
MLDNFEAEQDRKATEPGGKVVVGGAFKEFELGKGLADLRDSFSGRIDAGDVVSQAGEGGGGGSVAAANFKEAPRAGGPGEPAE